MRERNKFMFGIIFLIVFLIILNVYGVLGLDSIYVQNGEKLEKQDLGSSGFTVGDSFKTISLSNDFNHVLGTVKNVVIKSEGDGVVIEFKEGGAINSKQNENWAFNVGVTPGGKFSFDSSGKLVKSDFEVSEDWKFSLNGNNYELKKGTKLKFENGIVTISVSGGSFTYSPENDLKKKKTFSNIKDGGTFSIDKEGKIKTADFEMTKDTKEVSILGYLVNLKSGAKVSINEKKVDIKSNGNKLEEPKKDGAFNDDDRKDVVFNFHSDSGFIIPNSNSNEVLSSKSGETVVSFDSLGFNINGEYNLKTGSSSDSKNELDIKTNGKSYLFFDGEKHENIPSYISLGGGKLYISSLKGDGPAVSFLNGNTFGILIDDKHSLGVMAKNGFVLVEKALQNNVAIIKLNGESLEVLDSKTFHVKNGDIRFDPKNSLISGINSAPFSTPVQSMVVNDNGENLKDFVIFSTMNNEYAAVKNEDLKSGFQYANIKNLFFVSSNLAFNLLTPDSQKFFNSLDSKSQEKIFASTNNGANEGVSSVQKLVDSLIQEEKRIRQNPVKASVRIPTGGGSGTIIGVDKDGYPLVLSAGHLGGASNPGKIERIELANGKSYSATVLGGYNDYIESGNDYSLMKINTKIEGVPYVPVASTDLVIQQGAIATRIGCPGCGDFKITNTQIGRVGYTIGVTDEIHGGESGGGLFYQGRLIGVVSTGGHYTGTDSIRQFLSRMGYSYLIQFYLILIR